MGAQPVPGKAPAVNEQFPRAALRNEEIVTLQVRIGANRTDRYQRANDEWVAVRVLSFKKEGTTGDDVYAMVWRMMQPFVKPGAVHAHSGKAWCEATPPYWVFTTDAYGKRHVDRRNNYMTLHKTDKEKNPGKRHVVDWDNIDGLCVEAYEEDQQTAAIDWQKVIAVKEHGADDDDDDEGEGLAAGVANLNLGAAATGGGSATAPARVLTTASKSAVGKSPL